MNIYEQPFEEIVSRLNKPHEHLLVTGLDSSARAVLIAQSYERNPRPMLVIDPSLLPLQQLQDDLQHLLPEVPIVMFEVEESLAMTQSIRSYEQMADRVNILQLLSRNEPCIILTSVAGARHQLTSINKWRDAIVTLQVGQEYDVDALVNHLVLIGYRRELIVEAPGEFSVRGGIIDVFPLTAEHPLRLDFFDIELDSIRRFNATTQESIENLEQAEVLPATDILFDVAEQQTLLPILRKKMTAAAAKMKDAELKQVFETQFAQHLEALEQGEPLRYASVYYGLYDDSSTCLIDYLNTRGELVVMEYNKISYTEQHMMEADQQWLLLETAKGDVLPDLQPTVSVYQKIRQHRQTLFFSVIQKGFGNMTFDGVYPFQYRTMTQFFGQMPLVKTEVDHWLKQEYLIQVLLPSQKQVQHTADLFEEWGIDTIIISDEDSLPTAGICLTKGSLTQGFELPLKRFGVLTEKELFNKLKQRSVRKQVSNLSNAERIKSYNELNVGDYVVHIHHGVGRYTGMETLEISGTHRDLLVIEYQGQARVMLPVDQIHLIQKYVGSEAKTPKINKLGGTEWAKTKQKVASKIEDIADELLVLYAQREQEIGYAFAPDTPEQQEFEEAFGYVETDDQLRSAQEIKEDMEKPRPMDRLLVGDVGYGKTEVAMRAIFKAVMEGKQVAFLVPTTILAQQHYNTLVQRFADYPFEIGLLSRFVTPTRQKEVLKGLKNGAISIVVGTHRLLSQDVVFEDLGLLIVDEEQRFGVKHKERLKQLKEQVDVLTLTATPIPRTLHMSMIGVRDLSVIETPPNNRFPVQTYVIERNDGVIKAAIERELSRGGQVFYLYNRVATIDQRAYEIQQLVPDARVAVAHGQMSEVELETILVDFIQGAYDVLVTTTIIETGVDIPNANTLFVDNADHMGLSTLYQLRGRVGRTNRVAYAYLMYEPFKQLSEVSEKRLNAIREFTELGSGFKIAMRDLSIRGAGNLLGKQQSGFIDSVGFDLYSQMLKEAVDVKRGKKARQDNTASKDIDWDVTLDAYIPNEYVEDERQKISLYKAIQRIHNREDYTKAQDMFIDRYGEFPDAVSNLLDVALIKTYALQSGVISIKQARQQLFVTFNPQTSKRLAGSGIFEVLQSVKAKANVKMTNQQLEVILLIQGMAPDQWLQCLIQLSETVYHFLNKGENISEIR